MTRLRAEITEIGLEELRAELDDMAARGHNPHAAFEDVVTDFLHMEHRVFATHGASQHVRWAPLSKEYARRKGRNEMLVDTGKLRASLIMRTNPGGIRRVTRDSVTVGTRVKTANLHQQDRNPGKGKMPRRQLIHLTQSDADRWVDYIADFVIRHRRSRGIR